MTGEDYLQEKLAANRFDPDTDGKSVTARRDEVEGKLRERYGSKIQTVKYSGSVAKGTAIANSYDLDLAVHFKSDAFDALKEMYDDVFDFLDQEYDGAARRQLVSVGLPHLHVDVVPGRRIDAEDTNNNDVNLHRTDVDGERIKTNIEKQKKHVSESQQRDMICLAKVWRDGWNLHFKSFGLELLVIKALDASNSKRLDQRMALVLEYAADKLDSVVLTDPGNSNNDVAETIPSQDKRLFKTAAATALSFLEGIDPDSEGSGNAWRQAFNDPPALTVEDGSGGKPRIAVVADVRRQPTRRHG